MKSDKLLSIWHNDKKSKRLKLKIKSITYSFHIFDVVLTLVILY